MPDPTPTPSPLAEAAADSLQLIFSNDPFNYQRQDRDRIVAELRRARANWDEAQAQGKSRVTKPAKPKMTLADLDELKL